MPRIPLEDNFNDVINKTQRGLKITDEDLATRAEVTAADLAAVKGRQVASTRPAPRRPPPAPRPDALEALAHKALVSRATDFKRGFAMFNTPSRT
jgi:hydroxyacylglutathione hydrolase